MSLFGIGGAPCLALRFCQADRLTLIGGRGVSDDLVLTAVEPFEADEIGRKGVTPWGRDYLKAAHDNRPWLLERCDRSPHMRCSPVDRLLRRFLFAVRPNKPLMNASDWFSAGKIWVAK